VAETPQTPWRAAWVRAVARRMKAWAEAVLAEEPAPAATAPRPEPPESAVAGPRGTDGAAPPSPAAMAPEPSFEDLEARWLRDLEARRSVPLGDWVARVRRGAPRFLDEVQRDGLVPAPARGATRPTVTAHGPPPPAWTAPNALPPAPPPDFQTEGGEAHARRESPPAIHASSASRPSPPPAVPFWTAAPPPRPEAEVVRSAPATPPSPAPRAAFRAPAPPEHPPVGAEPWPAPAPAPAPRAPPSPEAAAPVRRSPWDDLPPFASEGRATRKPTRVPPPMSPPVEEEPLAPMERVKVLPRPAPPRAHAPWAEEDSAPRFAPREPARNQVSSPMDEGAWDGARSPLTWRPRLVDAPPPTEAEFSATHDEPAAGPSSPWPELPPAPVPESTETVVELRQWERRRRLDREQRGE
jgi:hypothetical protein